MIEQAMCIRTNEEDKAVGRGREARVNRVHAMDDRGLEVNVENAEHVNSVQYNPKCH